MTKFSKQLHIFKYFGLIKTIKITKIVKDSDNEKERDYIFQDNKKTCFGAGFFIIVLIILITAVIISGLYFEWF